LQIAPRGLLRIAVPVTLGLQHVVPAVSAYMARYPEVNFDIDVSNRVVNLIEEGSIWPFASDRWAIPT
jgi:DNA-binding transcriptional LysR family regulator